KGPRLDIVNDTIPKVNPYRQIIEQPSFSRKIGISAGLPGLGVGLLTGGAVLGIGIATTEEGSWDRLGVYVLGLIVFPITSSFTTGIATVKTIKRTTPPEYH